MVLLSRGLSLVRRGRQLVTENRNRRSAGARRGSARCLRVTAVAATPPWVLPRSVADSVYDRRDSLIFGGHATPLSIGLGLAFAALVP